jgi:hypothetical protein
MIVPFSLCHQRRIYRGMVIEYLRPAPQRNLSCDDEHEGSFSKEPTFAFEQRSSQSAS